MTDQRWASEPLEQRYARHTRNAAVTIAWILGIVMILSLVGTILVGVGLAEIHSVLNPLGGIDIYGQ